MALNETVVDDVANSNFKVIAGFQGAIVNLALADAVAHQRTTNAIREGMLAAWARDISGVDPTEALANLKQMSGNDLGQIVASLGTALSAIQQFTKAAQTTVPETGAPK